MSRKKKHPPPPPTVDYFAELRRAVPDRYVYCEGCAGETSEHRAWCEKHHAC